MMACNIKLAIFVVLITTALVQHGETQVLFSGACADLPVVADFDVSSYMGLWYEFEKYPAVSEMGGKCITTTYSLSSSGAIDAVNSQYNIYAGNVVSADGTISIVDGGKLLFHLGETGINYCVLDTDYTNYSVVYSCIPLTADINSVGLWILTRDIIPSAATIAQAISVVTENNLPINQLTVTDNVGC